MREVKKRHYGEVRRFIENGDYEMTEGGILVHGSILAQGMYVEGVNGGDWRSHKNLVVDQGIAHILNVVFGATAKISAWYIAPYSGAVTPAANWTAANFASNATEITSTSEGFSETTRQQFVSAPASGGVIGNLASKATFSIVCTTSININGAGLLSDSARGGTSGVLASAVRFGTTRIVVNGDTWQCTYTVSLTDS